MKRTIAIFAVLIIALLSLLKLSTYSYISGDLTIEIIISLIALTFFGIGFFLSKRNLRRNTPSSRKINPEKIAELGLSNREYEVLQEISTGLSNKEIAEKLFVTESTVKTHVSNLFVKLDAKRRTQAIRKAKEFKIIV